MPTHLPNTTTKASGTARESMATKAAEINQLHEQAFAKAAEAVDFARKAGELLLEVKDHLKHGQFQNWIEAHCSFSVRQSQRYMNAALGKNKPTEGLFLKNDTTSHLEKCSKRSLGIWKDGKWIPERGCVYLFKDDLGSTYWVMPSENDPPQFHICKHYSGKRMPTKDMYWRYTVCGDIDDPDFTHQFYVGTRIPLLGESGVAGVLETYGLKDIKQSLLIGKPTKDRFQRPIGEPEIEHPYWEKELADLIGGTPYQNPESATHPTGGSPF